MSKLAKSRDENSALRYFVEEQMVAMPALVAIPAIFALIGQGGIMMDLRAGFTTFWGSAAIIPALLIGSLYAALCVCGTLVYLDRRENTFCIPLNRCSSVLSGIVASYALFFLDNEKPPNAALLTSAGLITVALLFLSPLHHVGLYLSRLKSALARNRLASLVRMMGFDVRAGSETLASITAAQPADASASGKQRRIFLFVCSGNTCRSAMAEAIGNAETASRLQIPAEAVSDSGIKMLSAGVSGAPGRLMTAEAQEALRRLSVPVPAHTTRLLTAEMADQAEVIFCMTRAQRDAVIEMFPPAAAKVKCLDPDGDISDPIGLGLEVFLHCAKRIQELVRLRFDDLGLQAQF